MATHTLTGTTDTLTISGIPADGGVYDTLKVWFTNDATCGDTVILKRPVPCPTDLGSNPGEICSTVANTEIKGTVFEDWNYDGVMNQSDTIGVQGIQVLAYDCDNNIVDTTYTDPNGNYEFTGLTNGEDYRIEFILPESVSCWAKPTQAGADNGTTVQFVQPGNCASLGVANPTDYCEANPNVFTPCYIAGDPFSGNPLYSSLDAMVTFPYNSSGNTKANLNPIAFPVDLGATWGVAYQQSSKNVFTSAILKRHFGFGAIDGANPTTGGIYAIDVSNIGTPSTTKWLDVNTIGINTGTNPRDGSAANSLAAAPTTPSYDYAAYDLIGKIGIGDIDMQGDSTLWLVNLADRSLYGITNVDPGVTPTSSNVIGPISLPATGCGSGEGDVRPWGLEVYQGKVYVGAVCTGEASQDSLDLHAYIFEYDPVSGVMASFFDFDMNYERGRTGVSITDIGDWRAWQSAANFQVNARYNMQPMLADIDFDGDGSLIIGIMDRWGLQVQDDQYDPDPTAMSTHVFGTYVALGDVLRACNVDGTLVFEGGTGCGYPALNTNGTDGSGNDGNEYYQGDYGEDDVYLHETAFGSLLYLTGNQEVMITQFDPFLAFNEGGTRTLDNTTGDLGRRYLIYDNSSVGVAAKGVGLGDLVAGCTDAPVEIGNYVWEDTDGDGIQDACEPGLADVRVELYSSTGTLLAFDTTDANGQYYFSHSDSTDQNWIAATDSVEANTSYYILVGQGQFAASKLTIGATSYQLTIDSTDSGANRYAIDSDAEIGSGLPGSLDGFPVTSITTGDWGCVDHSFDFGFYRCDINILSYTSTCTEISTNNYTANWQLSVEATGVLGTVTYRRNSESNATYTPASQCDTTSIIISTIADGGIYDTLYVYSTADNTCADTLILKRPVPCPSDVATCTSTSGCLGGNVFEDFNCNGTDDTNEPGIQGIYVIVYDCDNMPIDTIYTDSDGDWQLCSLTDGEAYRVEFVLPESIACWATPTHVGPDNGSSVQFLTVPDCTKFSVINSADYCESNPSIVTPCYINGAAGNLTLPVDALVKWSYNNSGTTAGDKTVIADKEHIGATWGVAYRKKTEKIYASAFLKRHVGLLDNDSDGNGDLGAIYEIDPTSGTPNGSLWLDIATLGINVGTIGDDAGRGLTTPTTANNDATAYDNIGKIGLGDIDISEDESTLYVMNLFDKTLYAIDIENKTLLDSYPVPDPGCGNYTPGHLRIHSGSETSYTDTDDNIWFADVLYKHSEKITTTNTITNTYTGGTSGPELYQSYNETYTSSFGGFSYTIPLSNDTYTIKLHYAEPTFTAAGLRVFDVAIEGNTVATNFDIYATAGATNQALVMTYSGQVLSDGELTIEFTDVTDLAIVSGIEIIDEAGLGGSTTAGDYHPFAVKVDKGNVFVGVICDAQASQDEDQMSANVYKLEAGTYTNVLSFPLNYTKGNVYFNDGQAKGWHPWVSNIVGIKNDGTTHFSYQQPILSDIEFDEEGFMILGFIDRFGHQIGHRNYGLTGTTLLTGHSAGDILMAAPSGGTYTIETNAVAGTKTGDNPNNNEGPNGGEFFDDNIRGSHREQMTGGIALLPGSGEVVSTGYATLGDFDQGVVFFSTTDGSETDRYQILTNTNTIYFGKGAGLGDLELLCDPAPLEIGNYVWCDSLENGIQDACERGIDGIIVQLYSATGTLVGQDSTSNSGQYYFNQNNVDTTGITVDGSGISSPITSWSGMSYSTQYFIVFGGGQFATDEFTVGSEMYGITSVLNTGTNDNIDSDVDGSSLTAGSLGARPDGLPFIDITTNAQGCGDHKYDLGVTCSSCFSIDSLITDRTICSGDLIDTFAITTTFSNPDSVAFVYFSSQQTDSTLIYTNGTGIDTLQISVGNDTIRITNVNVPAFVNVGTVPDTFFVYAIKTPVPTDLTCRPYDEILVIVNPIPAITASVTDGCSSETLATMTTNISGGTWTVITDIGTTDDGSGNITLGTNNSTTVNQDTIIYSVNGCPDTVFVTTNAIPSIAATSSNPTTCAASDGSITLTLTNVPNGTYTINYMDAVPSAQTFTNVSVSSGSATISSLSAGTYNDLSITVSGCISTENVDITLTEICPCELTVTTTYSENCTEPTTNNFTADWKIGFEVSNALDTDISYQRNSGAVATHTLTGTTDTLTIVGIPADGGVYDTLRVWFTNETTCGDTVILKRPVPCPTNLGSQSGEICISVGATEIAGTVYEDWNFDGTMNQSDTIGVQGIQVFLFDDCNSVLDTTYTDANGNYQFTGLISSYTYRIEFGLPESVSCWAKPTRAGTNSGTTVQFVQPGNCASLGVSSPTDYCETDPPIVLACYESGNAVYGGTGNENKGIVSVPYSSSGATVTGVTEVAKIYETGTVWGMAWQSNKERMFASSFLKRHSGFGPQGIGGVYVMDFASGTGHVANSFDLQGVTPANGGTNIDLGTIDRSSGADYTLPDNNTGFNRDLDAFDKTGKAGFGDADMADDLNTLWLVNLNQRALISVDVSDTVAYPGTVNQYPLDDFSNVPSCTNGTLRPWALAFNKGRSYVGCVCTAEDAGVITEMKAYVLSFDPTNPTSFTQEFSMDLDYTRENIADYPGFGVTLTGEWHPWVETFAETGYSNNPPLEIGHAQPIFTDIDFTEDGSMVLGLADRFGFQIGFNQFIPVSGDNSVTRVDAGGDLIKVANVNGSWSLEASEDDDATKSTLGTDGPSGTGEFFYSDAYDDTDETPTYNHNETFIGGLGVLKGTNEVVAVHYDPVDGNGFAFDLGLIWHNASNGSRSDDFRIVDSGSASSKGNGLGDPMIACEPAPLEIGNYVWCDSLENGLQDACETGIDGIIVQLYSTTGVLIGQDTTANGGQYYFNQYNVDTTGITVDGSGIASPVTAWNGLAYEKLYYVVFGDGQFTTDQFSVSGTSYGITPVVDAGSNDDIDSDVNGSSLTAGSLGSRPDGLPYVTFTSAETGCGDHKYDMGVTCVCPEITELITDREVCPNEIIDTLAALTTFANPDSIAFVYFASAQTDSSIIYMGGTGIDTVQIAAGNDTVRITNVTGFANTGSVADTFYVYAIAHPTHFLNSCRPYEEILVIVQPAPIADIVAINEKCVESDDGGAVAGATGGTAPYSFQWAHGPITQGISNLASGLYEVTVTDSKGCTDSASVTITEPDTLKVNLVSNDATCGGNNGTASAAGTGGTPAYSYEWSNGNMTDNPTGLAPGKYYVTVTDANLCERVDSVTINNVGAPNTGTETYTGCKGDGYTVVVGGSTYHEFNTTGTETIPNAAGCDSVITITLTFNDPPVLTSTDSTICEGASVDLIGLFSTTGGTTSYHSASPPTAGNELPSTIVTPTGVTVYYAMAVDANSCADTLGVTVTPNSPEAVFSFITDNSGTVGDTVVCHGEKLFFGGTTSFGTGTAPFTYQWSANPSANFTFDNASNQQFTDGTYTNTTSSPIDVTMKFVVTDGLGCMDSITFDAQVQPEISDSIYVFDDSGTAGDKGVCFGDSISFKIVPSPAGSYTYLWSTTETTDSINVKPPYDNNNTLYNVTVTDAYGCTQVDLTSAKGFPEIIATVDFIPACSASDPDTLLYNVSGGIPRINGYVIDVSTEASPINSFTPLKIPVNEIAGTIITALIDDEKGCGPTLMITVPTVVQLDVSLSSMPETCGDGTGTAMATPSDGTPGYTYKWSTGPTTQSISGLSAGGYDVTVTDAIGCTVTKSITVSDDGSPTNGTETYNGCTGDGYEVIVNGTTYSEALQSGTETIIGGAASGCDSVVNVTLVFNAIPEISTRDTFFCEGESFDLNDLVEEDNAEAGTITFHSTLAGANGNTGTISNTVSPTDTTKYYVRKTSVHNCFDVDSILITLSEFDLALKKTVLTAGPYLANSDVTFTIKVYNQGACDATEVIVHDYIPTGFTLNDANWDNTANAAVAVDTITTLAVGDSATLTITLRIDIGFTGQLVNNAEIVSAMGGTDSDSPLTSINDGSTNELSTDDDVDDNGTGTPGTVDNAADEDDYDPAQINVGCPTGDCPPVTVERIQKEP